jgi:hypothetical protein
MNLNVVETTTWPGAVLILGVLTLATFLIVAMVASVNEFRKLKIAAGQQDDLRQLVRRYEQLAENTLDAQQRVAADLSELRSRTASIEQILRTVE